MQTPPSIARSFLHLVVVYVVLVGAWWAVAGTYASLFRSAGTALFSRCFAGVEASFEAPQRDRNGPDTIIELRFGDERRRVRCDSRIAGYDPTALLAALVLATPIGRWRRAGALVIGLVLVHAFIGLRVGLPILGGLSQGETPYFGWAPTLTTAVVETGDLLARIPSSYVAPVFIWMIVAVRPRDWAWLTRSGVGDSRPPKVASRSGSPEVTTAEG